MSEVETSIGDEMAVAARFTEPEPVEPVAAPEQGLPDAVRAAISELMPAIVDEVLRERLGVATPDEQQMWEARAQLDAFADPFDDNYGSRLAELVDAAAAARVEAAVAPLQEELRARDGRERIDQILRAERTLHAADRPKAVQRASEIFLEWQREGAFQPHEQREAAEQALRAAAQELGRPKVPKHVQRILDKEGGDEEAVALRFGIRQGMNPELAAQREELARLAREDLKRVTKGRA